MFRGSLQTKIAIKWLTLQSKSEKHPHLIRDLRFELKLLTFQISYVRELKTLEYTYAFKQ